MKKQTFLCLALVTAATWLANAGTRSSANYSLTTETTDAGGEHSASANYVNDSSIGGIGGISAVAVPAETIRHGYIGQLYDLVNLRLWTTDTNVNESATCNLYATAVFDDASQQALAGTQVVWSVLGGPILGISSAGLITIRAVYQDTPATVRGIYQSVAGLLGLNIVNTSIDNWGIYADDGVDDAWQVQYFGDSNPQGLGSRDPDGDGQNNSFEYVAGTNPTNSASRFRFRVQDVPANPLWKDLVFSPRLESRNYGLEYRTDVASGVFANLTLTQTNDVADERTVRDLNATAPARFYRVKITLP